MSHPVTLQDGNPALSRADKYELGKVEALNTPDEQVVSEGGTVKLVGKVKTRHQRAEAERIARDVDGVDRVVNDLWVRDPPSRRIILNRETHARYADSSSRRECAGSFPKMQT